MAASTRRQQPRFEPKIGQTFGEGDLHTICDLSGRTSRRTKATAIGAGGAGSVFPCLYGTHQQRRAVKFLTLNKRDEEREGRREADFLKTFATERAVLSQLSHSNISIFHEDGAHTDEDGNTWHYLVTDYVAGPELHTALAQDDMTGEDIYRTFVNLFEAVAYLHRHGVYHCDIKPANIRLRGAGSTPGEVVLLDWGAAQVLSDAHAPESQTTLNFPTEAHMLRPFISTDDITHDLHKAHLKGAQLTSQDLWEFVPRHELHTLGKLLEVTTSPNEEWSASVRARLSRAVGAQGVIVLDDIIADLLGAPEGNGYRDVTELVADFAKLHRNYLAPAGVPELGLAAEFQYSTPTATGRAVMTPRFAALAGHRLVNRLHEVHQLESTYFKFSGATHSRQSHSLAVLHNTPYYISHLLNDSRFRRVADREEIEAALLLALLHDIGHFQLSHMFEDLATDQASHRGTEHWTKTAFDIPTDDTLFPHILGMPSDQLSTPLRGGYADLIADLARERHSRARFITAEDSYVSPAEVITDKFSAETLNTLHTMHALIYGRRKPETISPSLRVLAAVISSDVDADKTAYLLEDSQRTGVPYGLGVDLDGILGNLCMPTREDFDRPGASPIIGLRSAGIQAAQSVAVNRNQMLSQVYWNQSNRSVTAMVKYVIMRLLAADELAMDEYLSIAIFASRNEAMQWLADRFDSVFGPDEINPIVGVVEGAGYIYERVCEVREGLVDEAPDLNDKLIAMSYPQILTLQDDVAAALRSIPGLADLRPGELLVDIPSKERQKPSGDRGGRVYVYHRFQVSGAGRQLDEASPLYEGLRKQHRALNRVSRVFITPKRFAGLDQTARDRCALICVDVMKQESGM